MVSQSTILAIMNRDFSSYSKIMDNPDLFVGYVQSKITDERALTTYFQQDREFIYIDFVSSYLATKKVLFKKEFDVKYYVPEGFFLSPTARKYLAEIHTFIYTLAECIGLSDISCNCSSKDIISNMEPNTLVFQGKCVIFTLNSYTSQQLFELVKQFRDKLTFGICSLTKDGILVTPPLVEFGTKVQGKLIRTLNFNISTYQII
jgi:hypothetical protein